MAKATETPIYVASYELLTKVTPLVGNFPRNRRLLAQKLFEDAHDLVHSVFEANLAKEKVPMIRRVQSKLGSIQLSLRLSSDLRLVTPRQFGATVETAREVSKQASGWLKWAEARA